MRETGLSMLPWRLRQLPSHVASIMKPVAASVARRVHFHHFVDVINQWAEKDACASQTHSSTGRGKEGIVSNHTVGAYLVHTTIGSLFCAVFEWRGGHRSFRVPRETRPFVALARAHRASEDAPWASFARSSSDVTLAGVGGSGDVPAPIGHGMRVDLQKHSADRTTSCEGHLPTSSLPTNSLLKELGPSAS